MGGALFGEIGDGGGMVAEKMAGERVCYKERSTFCTLITDIRHSMLIISITLTIAKSLTSKG